MAKRAADLIVEQLVDIGVKYVFGIPGFTNLDIIDALRINKDINFILVRHEETAALMCSAYAKLTDQLGVCTSIAGPGATNLISGLYDAKMDRAPVLAITGQVAPQFIGTHEIQEIDQHSLFEPVSEFNKTITTTNEAAEMTLLAAKYAIINRSVSHLGVPSNIQAGDTATKISSSKKRIPKIRIKPSQHLLDQAVDIIDNATRPTIVLGWGARNALQSVLDLADKLDCPISTTYKAKGLISEFHPRSLGVNGSVGTKPSRQLLYESDLLIVLGSSFSKQTALPSKIKTVQIDFDFRSIGKRFPVELGILGSIEDTLPEIVNKVKSQKRPELMNKVSKIKMEWDNWLKRGKSEDNIPISQRRLLAALQDLADEDSIISLDAGDNSWWFGRHFKMNGKQKILLSGYFGIMGFGLASAIAAKIAEPDKQSITLIGDGAFAMLMADFTTAVKYNLPIKVFVFLNNELSMIRHEQIASKLPPYGIEIINPDYAEFANSCGGEGYKVENPNKLESIMKTALESKKPALIEVHTDPLLYWENDGAFKS
jgi:pyruvate oxidase